MRQRGTPMAGGEVCLALKIGRLIKGLHVTRQEAKPEFEAKKIT